MTPEQACEVLVNANIVFKATDPARHNYYSRDADFDLAIEAIADGNVARAAWEAVKARYEYAELLQCTVRKATSLVVCKGKNSHTVQHKVKGTDTAAYTTACAMALASKEERL